MSSMNNRLKKVIAIPIIMTALAGVVFFSWYWQEGTKSPQLIASKLKPGINVSDLINALGNPDRKYYKDGKLYFAYSNTAFAAIIETMAEIDESTGKVTSLTWSEGAGHWRLQE